jgi:hypothetical protein
MAFFAVYGQIEAGEARKRKDQKAENRECFRAETSLASRLGVSPEYLQSISRHA